MEVKPPLEVVLENLIGLMKPTLELISVGCVGIGLIVALVTALASGVRLFLHPPGPRSGLPAGYEPLTQLRLRFGLWLAVALEFQLAADIIASVIAPTFAALGKLAAIAVIRTFLNFFLAREINEEKQESIEPYQTESEVQPRPIPVEQPHA